MSQQKIVINKQVNGITQTFAKYECGTPAHMNIAVCNWSLRHEEEQRGIAIDRYDR